jgi:hypothetical protein
MDERLKFIAWLLDGEKMAVRPATKLPLATRRSAWKGCPTARIGAVIAHYAPESAHGAAQAAKRVLRKGPPEWQEEYSDWEFPPKPPWMRWKTYDRLDERAQEYAKAADALFVGRCRRLLLPGETIEGLVDRICGDGEA